MRLLLWPMLTIALYAVQTSWFYYFNTTQSPDLLLVLVLIMALEEGPQRGSLLGLGVGLLQDVVTFSFFGYHLLTRAVLGLAVGAIRGNIFKDRLPTFLVLTAIASVLIKVSHLVFLMFYQKEFITVWPFLIDMFKFVGWNVVCAVPMWIGCKVYLEVQRRRGRRYYRV